MKDIARFATLGTSISAILKFTFYQIPTVLPIALPISALIAAALLMHRMSESRELTVIRSCGLSLREIMTPLISIAIAIALLGFWINADLTPHTRGRAKKLLYETTKKNPLLLLQKDRLIKIKNSFIDLKVAKAGKSIENLLFLFRNEKSSKIQLVIAKGLEVDPNGLLIGKDVSFISNMGKRNSEGFAPFMIDHQAKSVTDPQIFSLLTSQSKKLTSSELPFNSLISRLFEGKATRARKAFVEIERRLSLAIAPLTFTLLGLLYGINISRNGNRKGIALMIGSAVLTLLSFLIAKSFTHQIYIASILYFLPHIMLLYMVKRRESQILLGVAK